MRFLVISGGGMQVIDLHTVIMDNSLERGACGVRPARGGGKLKKLLQ